ncbi:MAG: glutamine-hydrolyzing carbamoyl-phosphate synthase small subunit [Nannocystaceae bacterium]
MNDPRAALTAMAADPRFQALGVHGVGALVLADGRVFRGLGFGARATVVGEVVFNTSLTGYQEILSDPSYRGQLVCLTSTEIGNVGANVDDDESTGFGAEGLLCRALSPVVSNYRAEASLPEYLGRRRIPGLGELDTRALTRHLRERGAIMGALSSEHDDVDALLALARAAAPMEGRDLAGEVMTHEPYGWEAGSWRWGGARAPTGDVHVVVLDFGVKRNILRRLRDEGARVTVVPGTWSAGQVLEARPDAVLLSNGPGDPAALTGVIAEVRELLARAPALPIWGICLGHQLLALALGGRTYKLKFGHHGGNQPVKRGERALITAQNHGFAVDLESLGGRALCSDENLFDHTVSGIRLRDRSVESVQYHPEASPGPHDASPWIGDFVAAARAGRRAG